jgi:hypothetical protein
MRSLNQGRKQNNAFYFFREGSTLTAVLSHVLSVCALIYMSLFLAVPHAVSATVSPSRRSAESVRFNEMGGIKTDLKTALDQMFVIDGKIRKVSVARGEFSLKDGAKTSRYQVSAETVVRRMNAAMTSVAKGSAKSGAIADSKTESSSSAQTDGLAVPFADLKEGAMVRVTGVRRGRTVDIMLVEILSEKE